MGENLDKIFDVKYSPGTGEGDGYICKPTKADWAEAMAADIPSEPLPDNEMVDTAINRLGELVKERKSLQLYLDICVRCGACVKQCHYYLGTGDPKNTPVGRAELLRKAYRAHFTTSGKVLGSLAGAEKLTPETMKNDWYRYFYQCTECRRCSVFCPYGIDQAEITMAGREVLNSVGLATKYITQVISQVYKLGNNLGIPEAAFNANSEFIAEEVEDLHGVQIEVPVDKEKAEILYLPPSADLFTNVDTMIGVAKVFNAVGADWTMSTYASEAANFGLFLSYDDIKAINLRVVEKAKEVGAKLVIFGECGHAWRAARQYMEDMNGPLPFKFMNILEYTAEQIKKGRLKIDKSRNDNYVVTMHDPCNMARGGNLTEEGRYIINQVCNNFVDMDPNATREKSFCCGGGGGLLSDEIMDLRMDGGLPRAMAVKDVRESHGVNFLAAPCAIDKAQLPLVMKHYEMEDVEVAGIHDLVNNAMLLEGQEEFEAKQAEEAAAAAEGPTTCGLCDAEFDSMDECCDHAEKEHQISKDQCDMACEGKGEATTATCGLCDAEFDSMDECCDHAEKEHQISKDQCDMACE